MRVSTRLHAWRMTPRTGKTDRDAALKALTDNMAKLKALRLAREAAQPAPVAPVKKSRTKSSKKSGERVRHWRTGWPGSKAAAAVPRF